MADIRVDINPGEFFKIMKSPGVVADLEARGAAICEAAGGWDGGFETVTYTGRKRARVTVSTRHDPWGHDHGARAEALDQRLTRAIDAGRG